MNCKTCKHCKQHVNLITLANGGLTYLCTKNPNIGENGVVGDYDIISKKEHWKEYGVKKCSDYEIKEQKKIIFTKRKEDEYSFDLENEEYRVHGGSRHICQLEDKTWIGIIKKPNTCGKMYYLDNIDYIGVITEELEDKIIELCLLTN